MVIFSWISSNSDYRRLYLFVDLEWKIIYVGSAESEEYDQVLDSVLVGPLVGGKHKFVFQVSNNIINKIQLHGCKIMSKSGCPRDYHFSKYSCPHLKGMLASQ